MIYILVINETEGPILKALKNFDNFSLRKLENKNFTSKLSYDHAHDYVEDNRIRVD